MAVPAVTETEPQHVLPQHPFPLPKMWPPVPRVHLGNLGIEYLHSGRTGRAEILEHALHGTRTRQIVTANARVLCAGRQGHPLSRCCGRKRVHLRRREAAGMGSRPTRAYEGAAHRRHRPRLRTCAERARPKGCGCASWWKTGDGQAIRVDSLGEISRDGGRGGELPEVWLSVQQETLMQALDEIRKAKPHVLFLALGAPKQEFFIGEHIRPLGIPLAIGIGGSFELLAGICTALRSGCRTPDSSGLFDWRRSREGFGSVISSETSVSLESDEVESCAELQDARTGRRMKRRILFLHLGNDFGGIEVYLSNLAALLRADAEIVALCSHPQLNERLQAQAVDVVRLPSMKGPLRAVRFLLAAALLPFLVWKHRIDTVHINGHWESMLLGPARLLGCRAITTRHQTWDIPLRHWWHAPIRSLSSLVYNFNARFANLVISGIGSGGIRGAPRRCRQQNIVIPNWISCSPRLVQRVNHQGKTRLLFIGRLVVFKGLSTSAGGHPGHTRSFAHRGGRRRDAGAVSEAGAGLDVCFAGFHQDVQPFYDSADIFVMPLIGLEGLPLVSLEAMGNGLPCLFSDLPVHIEITDAGRTARLFRTGDATDLKQQLRSLIADEKQREQLACAAYERVRHSTPQKQRMAAISWPSISHPPLFPSPSLSGCSADALGSYLPRRPPATQRNVYSRTGDRITPLSTRLRWSSRSG